MSRQETTDLNMRPIVHVTVSGMVGTGKSRIMAEIEVALKAAGVPFEFATPDDQRAAAAEHHDIARGRGPAIEHWPHVVLREENEPCQQEPSHDYE